MAIMFPNKDKHRHHVYLSPAKRFELPLYTGVPAGPSSSTRKDSLPSDAHSRLDDCLRCGFPTPYFSHRRMVVVALKNLPPSHTVFVWHPLLKSRLIGPTGRSNPGGDAREVSFTLD
jgi:hypothetical protein